MPHIEMTDVVMESPPTQKTMGQEGGTNNTFAGPPVIGKDSWSLKAQDRIEAHQEERNRLLKTFPIGIQKQLN